MIYLNKGQLNTLVLNINNNTQTVFDSYSLVFTHIMSKETKTYTVSTSDTAVYTQNVRYCSIKIDLATDDLTYEGQYNLNIYGQPNNELVYVGITILDGQLETNPFTEYISPNEDNSNYIYIQE